MNADESRPVRCPRCHGLGGRPVCRTCGGHGAITATRALELETGDRR